MIISINSQKGGTGKTTTAAALAQAAAHNGEKVLVTDLDAQGNATFALGAEEKDPGSRGLLDGAPARYLIQRTAQEIDVIPAAWDLATIKSKPGSARRLQTALQAVKGNYDFIFIDTPPGLGELTLNALQAADAVIVPLLADAYSLQALRQVAGTVDAIRRSNPNLKHVFGIITQLDARSTLSKQMVGAIQDAEKTQGIIHLGEVRQSVRVKEAAALQESLYTYAPKCKPAEDYLAIFEKLKEYSNLNK